MPINEILNLIINVAFYSALIIAIFYTVNRAYETVNTISYKKSNLEKIKDYGSFLSFLHYNMDRAYDIIHKDQILIYSIEGIKLEEDKLEEAIKNFSRITLDFIGPIMKEELVDLYGNEDTLLLNMAEYFTTKYEEDEIRDESLKEIMGNNENDIDEDVKKLFR